MIYSPTKMVWDWSAAGKDLPANPHAYLKGKGSFQFAQHIRPEFGTIVKRKLNENFVRQKPQAPFSRGLA